MSLVDWLIVLIPLLIVAVIAKLDDGRVVGHVNVDDIEMVEQIDHTHIENAHNSPKSHKEKLERKEGNV